MADRQPTRVLDQVETHWYVSDIAWRLRMAGDPGDLGSDFAAVAEAVARGHLGKAAQRDVARIAGGYDSPERTAITEFYAALAVATGVNALDRFRNHVDSSGRSTPALEAWDMSPAGRALFDEKSKQLAAAVPEIGAPITSLDVAIGHLAKRLDAAIEARLSLTQEGSPKQPSRLRRNAAAVVGAAAVLGGLGWVANQTQRGADAAGFQMWMDRYGQTQSAVEVIDTADIRENIRTAEQALATAEYPDGLDETSARQLQTVAWNALKLNILYSDDPAVIDAITSAAGDDRSDAAAGLIAAVAVHEGKEPAAVLAGAVPPPDPTTWSGRRLLHAADAFNAVARSEGRTPVVVGGKGTLQQSVAVRSIDRGRESATR